MSTSDDENNMQIQILCYVFKSASTLFFTLSVHNAFSDVPIGDPCTFDTTENVVSLIIIERKSTGKPQILFFIIFFQCIFQLSYNLISYRVKKNVA